MAFESLSEKFQSVFKKMRKEDKLTEDNMNSALKEIRIALLEADVNYKVVKAFTDDVKEKAMGQDVLLKVNPSEMLVKICHDELVELLGADNTAINYVKGGPTTIMLVGLQGSGKTTTAGKLAYLHKNKLNKKVLLAGLDVYRPAAIDQLSQIASQVGVDFFEMGTSVDPVKVAEEAKKKAIEGSYDLLVLDTAGRLQIDEKLMDELKNINKAIHPEEVLLLVDAMAGQDAVNVANAFNNDLRLSGVIMSKLDGDAKGGAALSIKYLTGLPIKFAGIGEKLTDLDIFYPDRMASRILGMGDVVSLVEKAKEVIDEKEAEKASKKMFEGDFTLEDMLKQMKMVQKMGSLGAIAKMIPGMPKLSDEQKDKAESEMKNFETVINSMTPYERRHPEILKFSQKSRIAKGSGKTNADINRVIRKWEQSKDMMKQMKQYQKSGKVPPGFRGM
ncbi:MAG: signal recognition particle protein [Bacilli bacterium]|jgi:signal recognition particle subunit SRP54|nr:signal recognition particle protein [Bacilli bacterium]MCH4228350.1 signal recognition particle protein [Bacilli bacterium]MCH4277648.1 signal recognition particle protein [Bacilli bacterium]